MRRITALFAAVILLLTLGGCNSRVMPVAEEWPGEKWPTADPKQLGFSPDLLNKMEANAANYRINNIMIIRNGYKVYHLFAHEEFMRSEENLVPIYSCTKSIISALIGIAIEQGYISLDQKISDFFPEWQELEANEFRDSITIKHLLNQTSGWDWPEFGTWNYRISYLTESEDWIRCVLSREMEASPGTKFNYNTGGSHLLSVIVSRATGTDTLSYARSVLFDPIGIGDVDWPQDPQGYHTGGHGLWMSAEDLARFGLLYLNSGKWEDRQIVPEDWVTASLSRQSEGSIRGGGGAYGYQWWVASLSVGARRVETAYALGYAGQFIYVVPEFNLVVVATSQNIDNPFAIRSYMEQYILKALVEN